MVEPPSPFGAFKAAVLEAGSAILSFAPAAGSRHHRYCEALFKSDGSLVTQADLASEAILLDALRRFYPGDAVCSEESFSTAVQVRRSREWIVDPLDGTANLARGQADFAVLAARKEYGQLTFAIMHYPALGVTAEAEAKRGAFCNGARCRVSQADTIRPDRIQLIHCQANAEGRYNVDAMESTQALLELARGRCDGVVVRLCGHKVWDFSAPALIVEEAGGKISDGHGNPLIHDYSRFDVPYVVASNGKVHADLLDLLAAGMNPT